MDATFRDLIDSLDPKYMALLRMPPVKFSSLPATMPKRGIYLLSDGPRHLYVGRSNRLRARLGHHGRSGGTHLTAPLAFRMARESTGRRLATYMKSGSRADLMTDPIFVAAFEAAKRQVACLDIRFVEEAESTRQALLEIYAATVLKTPYNDFDNH